MTQSPSYVSQPQVVDLPKLLADVRGGHIQVPRFQRPFVWEDERRVELLRSLRAGIPIGSLLVWRTSQNRLRCFDHIAGVEIPELEVGQTASYLLDGHQRLTTLFAAFAQFDEKTAASADEDTPEPIYFDLGQNDFVVGNPRDHWSCMPLYLFLDAVALRQYFRKVERESGVPSNDIDTLQMIAEGVLYAMQWCRIPVIPLSTDDVELATRTFHRVNSQGVPMTEVHMVAALTWGDNFDLRETFEQGWAEHSLPVGWRPVTHQQTLNVLKGLLGMDLSRSPGDILVRRIRERKDLAKTSIDLLVRAMTLVSSHLVRSPVAIPYQMQLALTAIALNDVDDKNIDLEWLRRWWGLTTAWGSFAGTAANRIQAALRHLKSGLMGSPEPWPTLLFHTTLPTSLPNLELRIARARYFAAGYATQCQKDSLLEERQGRSLVSLVQGSGTRPGNRFLWESEKLSTLTGFLASGALDELRNHFVDEACIEAWKSGNFEKFITTREALMNAAEARWFGELRAAQFIDGQP